jgi:hypothetical protein
MKHGDMNFVISDQLYLSSRPTCEHVLGHAIPDPQTGLRVEMYAKTDLTCDGSPMSWATLG